MRDFIDGCLKKGKACGSIALLGAFLLAACVPTQRENDPKHRLSEYISMSFAVKNPKDKNQLMNYLTGDVKARLGAWSDSQFMEAFVESRRQFLKLLVREVKTISPSEVQITYELSYLEQGKSQEMNRESKITNKKLCQMVLENGKWYIADVRNIKELIEYKNALALP